MLLSEQLFRDEAWHTFKSAYMPLLDPLSTLKDNTTYMKPTEDNDSVTLSTSD
jgi:hypothetical protein